MPTLIPQPTRIQSAGNKPKLIDEYIGRVNSKTSAASVAHMRSPAGWQEPGQTPDFDEFTVVLKGTLHVEHENGSIDVAAGQAVIAQPANGFATPLPRKAALNTSQSASLRSHWRLSTATDPRLPPSRRPQACIRHSGGIACDFLAYGFEPSRRSSARRRGWC